MRVVYPGAVSWCTTSAGLVSGTNKNFNLKIYKNGTDVVISRDPQLKKNLINKGPL